MNNNTNKKKLETVVSQAILLFCNGRYFRPALAGGVIAVARQCTTGERLAGGRPEGRDNVGFSVASSVSGRRLARWVLGCHGDDGRKFSAKPISDGYLMEAHDFVEHHRRQLGDLEVEMGAYKRALLEVQYLHGVPGLTEAWEDFCSGYTQANYRPAKVMRSDASRAERVRREPVRTYEAYQQLEIPAIRPWR